MVIVAKKRIKKGKKNGEETDSRKLLNNGFFLIWRTTELLFHHLFQFFNLFSCEFSILSTFKPFKRQVAELYSL